MDFGASAVDYEQFRKGFPASFFDRVPLTGRVLDVGSGTGSLANGYAARGVSVVALDISRAMLARGGRYPKVIARAESLPFVDEGFTAVIAGQCWHWLDGDRAAAEAHRVLLPGGTLAIAHFDYLAKDENPAAVSERALLASLPSWGMAGSIGIYDVWRPHLEGAGFVDVESFHYDEDVEYTHAAWRGRMRACNAALRLPSDDDRKALDERIGEALQRFPDPLTVPHRVFVIAGRRTASLRKP